MQGISSIIFLTIGIQVVIFSLANHVSYQFTPLILAFYYLGASIAAIFFKKFQILLEWNTTHKISFARIFLGPKKNNQGTSFIIHNIFSSICVIFAILGVFYWHSGKAILLLLIFSAAFFYEILALAILDRIGLEERLSNSKNVLMRVYGFMGVSAAISLWILSVSKNSTNSLFFTLFVCTFLSIIFTRRKMNQIIS